MGDNHHSPSQNGDRLHRYRARRLRFMINGDKLFNGVNYALNTEKIRSFDALLNDLTGSLSSDHLKLCKGVRYIFNLQGDNVTTLNDFQDGNTYLCSSTDTFIMTDYRISNGMLNWLVRNSACISSSRKSCPRTPVSKRIELNGSRGTSAGKTSSYNPNPSPTAKLTSHNNSSNKNINGNSDQNHFNYVNKSNNLSNHNITNTNLSQTGSRTARLPNSITPRSSPRTTPSINSSTRRAPKKTDDGTNQSNGIQEPSSNSLRTSQAIKPIQDNHFNAGRAAKVAAVTSTTPKPASKASKPIPKSTISKNENESSTVFDLEVLDKYDIGNPIGDGHFSIVYCCMNKSNQEFCALKLIDKSKCRGRDDMIYNEVKILKQLDHPNIVKLIEEFDHTNQLYLILELVQDGDLFDAISTVTKFSEVHVATMIHNLSSALTYLHKQGIVHRDIKPENLLISIQEDGSHSLKLADFGLAVEVSDNPLYSVCGTAFYVSPEMLNESGYDYKVDVWSTGVICFILLCGYPPFTSKESENNQDELFDAILAGDFQFAPPYWTKISQHAKNLINCMLIVDPEKRFTAEQVFKHPWTMGTSNNFDGIDPMNTSRRIAMHSSQ